MPNYTRGPDRKGGWKIPMPAPDEKRCVRITNSGVQCKGWRLYGMRICIEHSSPIQLAASRRNRARDNAIERAKRKVATKGYTRVAGAEAVIEMLEDRLSVQNGMALALDGLVEKLAAAGELRYEGKTGEQLRGELQAWVQINQMVTKLGADYLRIGLDERKVRIAEAQARILLGVIQAILKRLDLTTEQRKIAAVVVPEELSRAAVDEPQPKPASKAIPAAKDAP
jgi:hypothetical protein